MVMRETMHRMDARLPTKAGNGHEPLVQRSRESAFSPVPRGSVSGVFDGCCNSFEVERGLSMVWLDGR